MWDWGFEHGSEKKESMTWIGIASFVSYCFENIENWWEDADKKSQFTPHSPIVYILIYICQRVFIIIVIKISVYVIFVTIMVFCNLILDVIDVV